jgi:hypothetical protein
VGAVGVTIDDDGPVPVYQQFAAIIARRSIAGLAENGQIPAKDRLVQEYGIARARLSDDGRPKADG